jgi:CarD family transcriptional regulator
MFDIGDRVFHPRYGAGVIQGFREDVLNGDKVRYYVIPRDQSTKLLVPVAEAEANGLRPIVSVEEVERILNLVKTPLSSEEADPPTAQTNKLDWSDPYALAGAIRHLRAMEKMAGPQRKLLERAARHLAGEIALALDVPEQEANNLLLSET